MKKLLLNKEFLRRHLFALVIMAGMGVWFGYDGFVSYPRMSAAALYESIESAKPPAEMSEEKLAAFKAQKIMTQHGLCYVLLFAATLVGLHLWVVSRLDFSFDETGFVWGGKRYAFADIQKVDRTKWPTKGILKLTLADGAVTLDAWHHAGVAEFEKQIALT